MSQVSSLVRITFASGLLLALGGACGGQSFSGGGDGSDAGSSQGGTSSTAGTTSSAGKGHAGHATGGSSSAGTGNVGATSSGGTSTTGGTSTAGGTSTTGGTGAGGGVNFTACNLPSDCQIRGNGCCGVCDSPNLTTQDFTAFNRMYANLFQCGIALTIPAGGTGNAGVGAPIACAPCPSPPAGTPGTMMYFVPDCVKGQCIVEDLRTSQVTACRTSDECKIRNGTGCCQGCSSNDQISVRNDGSFEKLVCSSGPVACPACAPLPTSAIPVCDGTTGHCAIAYPIDDPVP